MIDLGTIQAYIPAGTGAACRQLGLWLAATPIKWAYGPLSAYDIVGTRNRIIRYFLSHDVPLGKEYLLMIDANAVPIIQTNEIISTEGDLLYCGMAGREGRGIHTGDEDFGVKCFRASASVLQRMKDPWFIAPPESSEAARPCECESFRLRAYALGFEASMAGIVGHLQECVVFPSVDSQFGWKIAWPSDLPYERIQNG